MTRIREEAAGGGELRDAVRRAVAASGGTVTSAGLVLAGTFAVLTVAGDSQTRRSGSAWRPECCWTRSSCARC